MARKSKDFAAFVKELSEREGKKEQQNIAELSEATAIICDMIVEDPEWLAMLLKNGVRRQKLVRKQVIEDPELNFNQFEKKKATPEKEDKSDGEQ